MATVEVHFRFHGELNTFISSELRERAFIQAAGVTDTLKHVVESLGVPHTEVARITVDGTDVPDTTIVREGACIEVWPHRLPLNLDNPRFVLDGHLGRLAAYLRMLGFDVWYDRYADDPQLARVCLEEQRLLLTRDVGLLKRKDVKRGSFVRAHKPQEQLVDVLERFGLADQVKPFTRCMECNGCLATVPKVEVEDILPPHTRETKDEFKRCTQCAKVYWKGSHHAAMLERIRSLSS